MLNQVTRSFTLEELGGGVQESEKQHEKVAAEWALRKQECIVHFCG